MKKEKNKEITLYNNGPPINNLQITNNSCTDHQ